MKFFVVFLILIGAGVGTADGQASGSVDGNIELGCSGISADANADANGNSAGGSASLSGDGCGSPSGSEPSGYKYTFTARRTSQTVPGSMPLLYLYYQISPEQNITYFKPVNEKNPYMIEYYLRILEGTFENSGGDLNGCAKTEMKGWEYAVISITHALLPSGKCDVKPGNYYINQETDPITVYFDEKIDCGTYELTFNMDYGADWAFQADYSFNIEDDGTCNPVEG